MRMRWFSAQITDRWRVVAVLLLMPALGWGQQLPDPTYGKNVVAHTPTSDWRLLNSPHFEVHYTGREAPLAQLTARYAEQCYQDFRKYISYRAEARYQIVTYASPQAYLVSQARQYESNQRDFYLPRVHVYFTGSQPEYYAQLRTALARSFLEELYYGGGIASTVSSRLLLYVPDWYLTGAAEYLGRGWTAEDEAYLKAFPKRGNRFLDRVINSHNPGDYIPLKKSVWYYIESTYGARKLADVLYITRLARSVESGISSILGKTMVGFTKEWTEFVVKEFERDRELVTPDQVRPQVLPSGASVMKAVPSPTGEHTALVLEREGRLELWLQALGNPRPYATGIGFGRITDLNDLRFLPLPVAWSPDGTQIVTAGPQGSSYIMMYYNLTDRVLKQVAPNDVVTWWSELKWHPRGGQILGVGSRDGQADIYVFPPEATRFGALTSTPFSEANATWSASGNYIYYTANGGDSLLTDKAFSYTATLSGTDVYRQPYPPQRVPPQQLTFTPYAREWNLIPLEESLFFLSDESGLGNLYRLPLDTNTVDPYALTNYNMGLTAVELRRSPVGRLQMEATFRRGSRLRTGSLVIPADTLALYPGKTREADRAYARYLQLLLEKVKVEQAKARADSAAAADTTRQVTTAPPPDTTTRKRLRYYVFDEATDSSQARKNAPLVPPAPRTRRRTAAPAEPFNIDKVAVGRPGLPVFGFDLRAITVDGLIDPLFGPALTADFQLTDPRLNHRINVRGAGYLDFVSSDVGVRYEFLKYRLHLVAELDKSSRRRDVERLEGGELGGAFAPLRYNTFKGYLGLSYPLNRYLRVGLGVEQRSVSRRDLDLLNQIENNQPTELNGTQDLTGLRAQVTFDNTRRVNQYVLSGIRLHSWLESYNSNGQWVYPALRLDARGYARTSGDIVLASRVTGGFSWGEDLNQRQTFLIGGAPDWFTFQVEDRLDPAAQDRIDGVLLANENVAAWSFAQFTAPIRGFDFGTRVGSRFAGLNTELRLPLGRMTTGYLSHRNLYNWQVVVFYDAGFVWDRGNPLSRREFTEEETVIAPPFDITLRTFRSRFLQSAGLSLRIPLFQTTHLNADVAWGVEDSELQPIRFIVSLGKAF